MTTLIIHPHIEIQKQKAFRLARTFLHIPSTVEEIITHPDLHLIDGTLSTSIGIDAVRELIRALQYHPYQSQYQVGLILFANMLTEEAQNSLLKTLEEPGESTRFILTTPHERFLLPTIRSRSQCIYVNESFAVSCNTETKQKDRIDEFQELDLVDKFLRIETLIAQEKEHPGIILDFLKDLTQHFRAKLIISTKSRNLPEVEHYRISLRQISRAQLFIKRNTNKRLTLENLLLQLEVRIMSPRSGKGRSEN